MLSGVLLTRFLFLCVVYTNAVSMLLTRFLFFCVVYTNVVRHVTNTLPLLVRCLYKCCQACY
jgi:hypothetical protein